jgi:hypothetical protein
MQRPGRRRRTAGVSVEWLDASIQPADGQANPDSQRGTVADELSFRWIGLVGVGLPVLVVLAVVLVDQPWRPDSGRVAPTTTIAITSDGLLVCLPSDYTWVEQQHWMQHIYANRRFDAPDVGSYGAGPAGDNDFGVNLPYKPLPEERERFAEWLAQLPGVQAVVPWTDDGEAECP